MLGNPMHLMASGDRSVDVHARAELRVKLDGDISLDDGPRPSELVTEGTNC